MQRCPTSTAAEVELLRADDIEPTLDELARMFHWGSLVECPAGRVGPQPEDAPVEVGERILWPLTMAADAWLDTARQWIPDTLIPAAYGLAAERGRDPGAFDALRTRRAALAAVNLWSQTFSGTASQLVRALERIVPTLRPSDTEPTPPEYDPPLLSPSFDLAPLVAATGLPLEYWQTHTSRHYIAVMDAIESAAASEAGVSIDRDPSKEAYQQLLCVVAQIRRRAAACHPAKN